MWIALCLSLLVSGGYSAIPHYNSEVCGRESTYTSFVLTDAANNTGNPTNRVPWAVQIRIKSGRGDFAVKCGGTLISEKHVLTAAHCFQKKFGLEKTGSSTDKMPGRECRKDQRFTDSEVLSRTMVTVGAMCTEIAPDWSCINEKQTGKTLKIKRFAMGDFYEQNCVKGNDIVILELDGSISGLEGANYACLPFLPNVDYPAGSEVTSFGWGTDPLKGFNDKAFPLIQIVNLETETLDDCNEKWGSKVPHDSFCTAEEEDKNVCSGDSGGGLTFESASREYLVAIVSYGTDCGQLQRSGAPKAQVNTDIRKHQNFIVDFMNGK